ncbi:MAG: hypothetical protein KKB02_15995 [Alphaproteobacteria bacterium]|nr:hypothetical protein [Alphaproteobacteria bacterium]
MSDLACPAFHLFPSTAPGLAAALVVGAHRITGRLSPRPRLSDRRSGSHTSTGPGGGDALVPHRPAGFFDFADLMREAQNV